MSIKQRVVVTGASGFLGRHLMPKLCSELEGSTITGLSSKDFDLTSPTQFDGMMRECRPDVLIHLAAYSGGIGANKLYPADFYHINTLITTYGFMFADKYQVKRLIYPMGGCSYPANASSPIDEGQMWSGFPQEESSAYSSAKKMAIVAANAYRKQKKLNSTILVPGNMYGEFDNFSLESSHVIPAMVRKFFEAKKEGRKEVVMWGTGRPTRDFIYAGDVAELMLEIIKIKELSGPINISSGITTSIYDLASIISQLLEYQGNIRWDVNLPDGQINKIFSVEKLKELNMSANTDLIAGLSKTIDWFTKNYNNKSDGIRL